jgi:hypothetical protein
MAFTVAVSMGMVGTAEGTIVGARAWWLAVGLAVVGLVLLVLGTAAVGAAAAYGTTGTSLDWIEKKARSRSNAASENQETDPGGVLAEMPKRSFGFVDFGSLSGY